LINERDAVSASSNENMLDKILFWVVLVWMVAMLVMAIYAVREVIKEDAAEPPAPDSPPTGDEQPRDKTS